MDYVELHCLTNFSFLRGASHPEELVEQAITLGYKGLAITDECTLAGVVRAHAALKQRQQENRQPLQLLIGTELCLQDYNGTFIILVTDREGYAELCRFITLARRAASKGEYQADSQMLMDTIKRNLLLWSPPYPCSQKLDGPFTDNSPFTNNCPFTNIKFQNAFKGRSWLLAERFLDNKDHIYLHNLSKLSEATQTPIACAGDVHMHIPGRKPLQDVLTATRLGATLQQAGKKLHANYEKYLRSLTKLEKIYPEAWRRETTKIAALCHFSLDELRYEYPKDLVPETLTPTQYLHQLVSTGELQRFGEHTPKPIKALIDKELQLIQALHYEHYFLTIYDIVAFAKRQGILCQGRGSAANSVVCYCLGITEVDPTKIHLLFERFISKERNEPPDIDVDFEHERREEVIQYIYQRYGRHRAALAASVVTYRGKSAIRDVGKALGLDLAYLDQLVRAIDWRDKTPHWSDQLRQALAIGTLQQDQDSAPTPGDHLVELVKQLVGFPRHLSQHVGGFVIAADNLDRLVPVENAAMPERTIIQWDKDDLEALGLLKVDVLALGMLSAIRKAIDYTHAYKGFPTCLGDIPAEDPEVYLMLQKADNIGVFQVESRAQSNMLPRLKPACYYDLVIQVAIVRPGPIQGDMVHPYLRRRSGLETPTYPTAEIKETLERTLGVPIFQEQVIKLAMVAAGFSAGEADQLRRAMANWKRNGKLKPFQQKLIEGMTARGHSADFAQRICNQISGFGEYGFPESHAASFALLVYTSSWLKYYEPAAFCCGLLNSQPMGFYSPSQLVQDAIRHDVIVLPVEINSSHWDHHLVPGLKNAHGQPAIRLGMRLVKGLPQEAVKHLIQNRPDTGYPSLSSIHKHSGLSSHDLEKLASAGAFQILSGHRYQARWDILEHHKPMALQPACNTSRDSTSSDSHNSLTNNQVANYCLPAPSEGENILEDYTSLGLTLGKHPLAILKQKGFFKHCKSSRELLNVPHKTLVHVVGLVVGRQRPGTATGVTFMTLEDEAGSINVVVWLATARAQRKALLTSQLMQVSGLLEREGDIIHIIAGRMINLNTCLQHISEQASWKLKSRDFH
ncbi:error-prone DNA polymerase [Oleiphilus messinensis]|uniref:Error-prone DNA polymerase n=2 Tax=Oleiphilus messinensis TaxID=141451 RepID=A0A1Y0I9J3_9GAMM|nr:error-prone DNA polymerase [Oleiphilus messinensis]ARU57131.1 error-prone DNA polymerase [Oleiphilus messinensis]